MTPSSFLNDQRTLVLQEQKTRDQGKLLRGTVYKKIDRINLEARKEAEKMMESMRTGYMHQTQHQTAREDHNSHKSHSSHSSHSSHRRQDKIHLEQRRRQQQQQKQQQQQRKDPNQPLVAHFRHHYPDSLEASTIKKRNSRHKFSKREIDLLNMIMLKRGPPPHKNQFQEMDAEEEKANMLLAQNPIYAKYQNQTPQSIYFDRLYEEFCLLSSSRNRKTRREVEMKVWQMDRGRICQSQDERAHWDEGLFFHVHVMFIYIIIMMMMIYHPYSP